MRTAKPPGSVFKMITGIAALEEHRVTEHTSIYDTGLYTKAGTPPAKCLGHGHTSIKKAIEVSCNYYFYDVALHLGQGVGTPYSNIMLLTKYVDQFGLNQKSGIELAETEPTVSSPEVIAKKGLSAALWNVSNMDEDKRAQFTQSAINRISKSYIPWADPEDPSLESRIQIEIQHELKRNLESSIGAALEPILPALINEISVL